MESISLERLESLLDLLRSMPGGMPAHGETRNIKVVIDGVGYDAQLKNQGFDREKYDGHADVIQVRYSESSALAKRLREVFLFCLTFNADCASCA